MDEKTRQLGEARISHLLWKFSIPAIIGMMASSLYTIIDRLFVGNVVGADAIAGMSVTMPISFILMAFGTLIGIGAGALVSIRLGEQKHGEAENILGNAFTLILLLALLVSGGCLFFLEPLLTHLGASARIMPYAKDFISIILYGSVFQYLSFGLGSLIRSEGNPRLAMMTQLINAGMNIVLDFFFVFLFHWGMKGTAVATVISQAISAAWVLAHFSSPRSVLKLRWKNLPLRKELVLGIFAIGMSPFFMHLAASVVNLLFNQGLGRYGGDAAIGAFGIISTLTMFAIMPIFGINQGVQPIIGYNYGAQKFERVKKALWLAIAAATVIVTAGFVVMELVPGTLLQAFTHDPELLAIGVPGMRLYLLVLPIVGFQIVSANFFQAIGKAGKSMVMAMLRQVFVLIPALLFLPPLFRIDGVWGAGPLSDSIACIVTALFLAAELRSLSEKSALAAVPNPS
ncbi:MAG: MATE family efflux transporter [Bacteroidota bacterium]